MANCLLVGPKESYICYLDEFEANWEKNPMTRKLSQYFMALKDNDHGDDDSIEVIDSNLSYDELMMLLENWVTRNFSKE